MTTIDKLQMIVDTPAAELCRAAENGKLDFLPDAVAEDSLFVRVVRSLARVFESGTGHADFIVLLRQAQVRALAAAGDTNAPLSTVSLRVRKDFPGIRKDVLQDYGIEMVPLADKNRLDLVRWSPSWLDSGACAVVEAACAMEPRRKRQSIAVDPVVSRLCPKITEYSGVGQREAVRAAFLSSSSSSTLVNLPTGGGKSLVFQLPALVAAKKANGVCVVIVPTVALAIDQAARFREFAREAGQKNLPAVSLAYHSGLSDAEKTELKRAIGNGSTPIVFTSPEGCVGALGHSLRKAAESGLIRLFAVDEAHIISSWGDGFRPAFQSLAGLRDQLLDLQTAKKDGQKREGFRTILLSATLIHESVSTLRRLFGERKSELGERSELEIVAEVILRPEPGYLVSAELSESDRELYVVDAMRHLPRPLILYATKPEDAQKWESRLRSEGFVSVATIVGGDMATEHGQTVLRNWKEGKLDVVIATSAFGLGVDQSDVRAVVHACVPESVDRFYQEVGRGGRDGNSCVSLMVWTQGDVRTAETLANETEITANRGLQRWRAMRDYQREGYPDDVLGVSLDALPSGYTISTQRNRAWNFKTLLRMARAGFIEFASMPDPDRETAENMTEADWDQRRARVGVRITDQGQDDERVWASRFEQKRESAKELRKATVAGFRRLLDGTESMHDIFRRTYAVPEYGISVAAGSGDCPYTRSHRCVGHGNPPAQPVFPDYLAAACSRKLDRLFHLHTAQGPLWVTYQPVSSSSRRDQRRLQRELQRVLERLSSEGVVAFDVPVQYLPEKEWDRLVSESPWGFVMRGADVTDDPMMNATLARATLLPPGSTVVDVRRAAIVESERHLIFSPEALPSPTHLNRYVRDLPHLTLSALRSELDA